MKIVTKLKQADVLRSSYDAALRYLGHRPRSEAELRARLRRKFDDEVIDQVLVKLKEQGLVNDGAFAQFWKENRESFNPRSWQLIKLELRQKGVDPEIITQVTAGLDDKLSAYRAGQRKTRNWSPLDYHSFLRKLRAFLRQRGFSYEVITHTVDRLWQEKVR